MANRIIVIERAPDGFALSLHLPIAGRIGRPVATHADALALAAVEAAERGSTSIEDRTAVPNG